MDVQLERRNYLFSFLEAFFVSLMVGAGESYLPAFVHSLGFSELFLALVVTLPMFIGACLQIIFLKISRFFKFYKSAISFFVSIQIFSLFVLTLVSIFRIKNEILVLAIVSIYWACGFLVNSLWNQWMGFHLKEHQVSKFFSIRIWFSQLGIFTGLIVGGLFVRDKWDINGRIDGFTILFLISLLFRSLSLLLIQSFKEEAKAAMNFLDLKKVFSFFTHVKFRNFFAFLSFFYIVIFISSPFVNPYLLSQLKMSYTNYMITVAGLLAGKLISLIVAEKIMLKVGAVRVFLLGAICLSPLPGFWLVSDTFLFVMTLQFFSGIGWGLFEFGLTVLLFKQISHLDKVPFFTVHYFFNSLSINIGAAVGMIWFFFNETTIANYYLIFLVGSILRTLISIYYSFFNFGKPKLLEFSNDRH